MKIVITSLLVLLMSTLQATPNFSDSVEKGKKASVSTPVNPPLNTTALSMQQLLEENTQLRYRLIELENRLENENGMLNYNYTMLHILSKIELIQKMEKLEDLKSEVEFSKMMSNTLLMLKK